MRCKFCGKETENTRRMRLEDGSVKNIPTCKKCDLAHYIMHQTRAPLETFSKSDIEYLRDKVRELAKMVLEEGEKEK